ncbi:hypothetical protein YYC_04142 [Plasmodium yoelii 17X]|uniref:Uncharacterized protein n=2 Tax=Plasmodium yoelii TaxID=5861 RepID=V7PIB9_PLAYE|nr:hypothetical protein YYC_04142 [Plasmodium yoelii 17X]
MAYILCNNFDTLRKFFHDELKASGEYNFSSGMLSKYCPNNNCDTNIKKINAGCLWLFNEFFGKSGTSNYDDRYKDVVVCIMIWLSYKLSLKSHDGIKTLNDFYSNHIENNTEYTKHKLNDENYSSYKKIIDKIKEYMDININKMSKFYELIKLLCDMNTAYTGCKNDKFSEDANKFVDKYKELLNDNNNTKDSSYNKVLRVLSNYYNNFEQNRVIKHITINLTSLPTEKTSQNVDVEGSKAIKTYESSSGTDQPDHVTITHSYDTTLSGSSLVNKLILVLSILVAIAIFLGISYKVNNKELKKKIIIYM